MLPAPRNMAELFQRLKSAAEYDEFVSAQFPHDMYKQTVAVMGFDPLLPEPSNGDDEPHP